MDEIPFQVEVYRDGSYLLVRVAGELDFANAAELDDVLRKELLSNANVKLTLDFHELTFLDSEGLKSLVRAYRRITESHGEIKVVGCCKTIGRLFDILGMTAALGVEQECQANID
jgi:anti-sigma B factor antagonist